MEWFKNFVSFILFSFRSAIQIDGLMYLLIGVCVILGMLSIFGYFLGKHSHD